MRTLNRHAERGSTDRDALDALLDEVAWGVLATADDAVPWQVPVLFARVGDDIVVHGSTGAGALRQAGAGAAVSFCVTSIDGVVVAHSTFDSSANYRSAVLMGTMRVLDGDEKWAALDALSDRMIPGRTGEVRAMTKKELAATTALALPITDGQWVLKARTGGPGAADEEHDAWTGVVPMRVVYGEPEAVDPTRPLPASVTALTQQG
ncbi:MAG: pyridoxamine 5'-phosphate oxidase family protein [Micrococcales bacterium]|nr:pyridoxamine 5'-phosphate oxidase family protein [Micrococcales bacterium]